MTLLDTAMAAAQLRVTERTVRRLVERGTLTNHGTPRRILISLEQILDEETWVKVRASRLVSARV